MTVAVTTLMPLGLPLASDPCHRGFVLVWLQQLLQLVPLRQPLVRCLTKKSTIMISTGFRLTRKRVKNSPSGVSSVSGTPGCCAAGAGSPGRLLLLRRGRVMIFGMGLTSRSRATLVAAWKACYDAEQYYQRPPNYMLFNPTHFDPVHDIFSTFGLKQELLALHSNSYHILLLDIVGRQTTLRILQGVLLDECITAMERQVHTNFPCMTSCGRRMRQLTGRHTGPSPRGNVAGV
jgi:hypothetical protein